MRVEIFTPALSRQLHLLVNLHLAAAVPGLTLTRDDLARHLERDEAEPVTDPWVVERATLCVVDGYRVPAAVHLLRYGDGAAVGEHYRGAGEIGWLLVHPDRPESAVPLLAAARERLAAWGVAREYGWGAGLPGPIWGVPDAWPHIAAALLAAGYRPDPAVHREALYGGPLAGVPAPGAPPLAGLALWRRAGGDGPRFVAVLDGRELGYCEVVADLARGGALPLPRGWAGLQEVAVRDGWRGRGIGAWLVRHAAAWLRLAGSERIVLGVADYDEAAGAGRFYERFGWTIFTRETHGWRRPPP
jgi:GNAT superfamily N-acetyltransferase